jgi:hypothetical protein
MAIYRILRDEAVFEPDAIQRMTLAYEGALEVLQITDRQDPITEKIAKKIIEIARVGETDPALLRDRALSQLKISQKPGSERP